MAVSNGKVGGLTISLLLNTLNDRINTLKTSVDQAQTKLNSNIDSLTNNAKGELDTYVAGLKQRLSPSV
jgi:hypothetical protein